MDTLDTWTHQSPDTGQQVDVNARLANIKLNMPETYAEIVDTANRKGSVAFALVRRAVRGEPNCFYAIENLRFAGTPFNLPDVHADLARYMLTFGCERLICWGREIVETPQLQQ